MVAYYIMYIHYQLEIIGKLLQDAIGMEANLNPTGGPINYGSETSPRGVTLAAAS